MMIFTKSRFHRLRKFNDALNAANAKSGRSTLRQVAMNAANETSGRSSLRRVAIAAGGLVGLTAASAGISSLRRREEARGDS
jgi:hypothetical protein